MKIKKLLKKMIYNTAWYVIKRIDLEAKEPGDFIRWKNRIFFIDTFDVNVFIGAPAKASLTMTEYRLRDILNPKTYASKKKEALSE